jgi:hypothetical protein
MELEYVNVLQLEPFKRVLHRCKDSLSRQPTALLRETDTRAHLSTGSSMINQSRRTKIFRFRIRIESLGQDHNTLPWYIVGFEEFTQDDFGFTIRVRIGCIE